MFAAERTHRTHTTHRRSMSAPDNSATAAGAPSSPRMSAASAAGTPSGAAAASAADSNAGMPSTAAPSGAPAGRLASTHAPRGRPRVNISAASARPKRAASAAAQKAAAAAEDAFEGEGEVSRLVATTPTNTEASAAAATTASSNASAAAGPASSAASPASPPSRKRQKLGLAFPRTRIKQLMQLDEDIGQMAAVVPLMVSRCLELFLSELVGSVHRCAVAEQAAAAAAGESASGKGTHARQTVLTPAHVSVSRTDSTRSNFACCEANASDALNASRSVPRPDLSVCLVCAANTPCCRIRSSTSCTTW